jgi:hypothetical protein
MRSSEIVPAPWSRFVRAALPGIPFLSLSLCLLAGLTGCSPEETSDQSPPDHIINLPMSQGKYRYGVTDTIVVGFSENIDTSALAVAVSPSQGVGTRLKSQSRLLIFGTNNSAGASHFTVNSPFTLTLTGLRDQAGNGRTAITESFQPYAWADRDFLDTTFSGYDSLFAADPAKWMDGSSLADSFVVEGRVDINNNRGEGDRQDFKILRMVAPDTLKLVLTCPKGLNMRAQIAGPFPENKVDSIFENYDFAKSFFSDSTRTRGSLSHTFNADYSKHDDLLGSPSAPGIYFIRLSIPLDTEGFYRLGLRLIKRNR